MRAAIRKKVTDGNLLDGMRAGLRGRLELGQALFHVRLPRRARGGHQRPSSTSPARSARPSAAIRGGPASVNASVGWLVPKPHTPFQWAAQQTRRVLRERPLAAAAHLDAVSLGRPHQDAQAAAAASSRASSPAATGGSARRSRRPTGSGRAWTAGTRSFDYTIWAAGLRADRHRPGLLRPPRAKLRGDPALGPHRRRPPSRDPGEGVQRRLC